MIIIKAILKQRPTTMPIIITLNDFSSWKMNGNGEEKKKPKTLQCWMLPDFNIFYSFHFEQTGNLKWYHFAMGNRKRTGKSGAQRCRKGVREKCV